MKNKLIPLSEFILKTNIDLDKGKTVEMDNFLNNYDNIIRYTKFLKQPLALWMFVPVDENNVPLDEPTQEKYGWFSATSYEEESGWMYEGGEDKYQEAFTEWQKSKERVLFEGFQFMHSYEEFWTFKHKDKFEMFVRRNLTVEKLIQENIEITLTATAIKSIYGS